MAASRNRPPMVLDTPPSSPSRMSVIARVACPSSLPMPTDSCCQEEAPSSPTSSRGTSPRTTSLAVEEFPQGQYGVAHEHEPVAPGCDRGEAGLPDAVEEGLSDRWKPPR
jgi:hypothetical protein